MNESQRRTAKGGEPPMATEQQKLKRQANRLYDRYAKPLEDENPGRYIAVSPKGEFLLGDDLLDITVKATEAFGRGNFVFKLGERVVGNWR
jgi:hypothetical protein